MNDELKKMAEELADSWHSDLEYDCLMVVWPIYKGSLWYRFEGDPWNYGGPTSHKMDFIKNCANFIEIDHWMEDTV